MRAARLALLAALLAAPAAAQETRSLTDDTGTKVTFPAEPRRIVSLHSSALTLPLVELGVSPVGSHGIGTGPDNAAMAAVRAATGVDFATSDIVWVGHDPADVEAIAALEPDLILTTQWQGLEPERLRRIAPTILLDYEERGLPGTYAALAEIVGRTGEHEALRRRYDEQIARLRAAVEPGTVSVSTIHVHPDGRLFAYNPYGSLGRVLVDAGFERPDAIEAIPEGGSAFFSPERLQEFDADFVVTTYPTWAGGTPEDQRALFEAAVPGFCEALHACREGQMVFLPREETWSPSYDGLMALTAVLRSHVAGRDFAPMPD